MEQKKIPTAEEVEEMKRSLHFLTEEITAVRR